MRAGQRAHTVIKLFPWPARACGAVKEYAFFVCVRFAELAVNACSVRRLPAIKQETGIPLFSQLHVGYTGRPDRTDTFGYDIAEQVGQAGISSLVERRFINDIRIACPPGSTLAYATVVVVDLYKHRHICSGPRQACDGAFAGYLRIHREVFVVTAALNVYFPVFLILDYSSLSTCQYQGHRYGHAYHQQKT
jgi:hypothetical protein